MRIREATLYDTLLALSKRKEKIVGGCCSDMLLFDLKGKSIGRGNFILMNKGVVLQKEIMLKEGDVYEIEGLPLLPKELIINPWETVEDLYRKYKYSLPTSRSGNVKSYFRACTSDDLTFQQMMVATERLEAKYALEAYLLLGAVQGIFTWPDDSHWYRSGTKDKEFIVRKQWVIM